MKLATLNAVLRPFGVVLVVDMTEAGKPAPTQLRLEPASRWPFMGDTLLRPAPAPQPSPTDAEIIDKLRVEVALLRDEVKNHEKVARFSLAEHMLVETRIGKQVKPLVDLAVACSVAVMSPIEASREARKALKEAGLA